MLPAQNKELIKTGISWKIRFDGGDGGDWEL